jgi:chorismate mutase
MIGIRGATTVTEDSKDQIVQKTRELLEDLVVKNNLDKENIVSVFFTMTEDLNSEFPAVAARGLGWTQCALMCARELNIKGSLPMCIRVLIHYEGRNNNPVHVYLNEAKKLRDDL